MLGSMSLRHRLHRLRHAIQPHSHHHHHHGTRAELENSAQGWRALWISLAGLAATAGVQVAVAALSGSVGLFGDALHNAADALTAVPARNRLPARPAPSHP